MPAKRSITILVFLFIYMHGRAGTHDSSKRFCLSEAYISFGPFGQASPSGTLENFRKLAPGSTLLMQNFTGFQKYASDAFGEGNSMLILGIGFRSNRKANGPTFRVSVGYGNGTTMEGQYNTSSKFRIDTMTSSRTGHEEYIDSTVYERYAFNHIADILKLDVSVVWRTSAKHKTKLFAGIGVFAGTSLNAVTTIGYSKYDYINYPFRFYPSPYRYSYYSQYSSETYQQKNETIAGVYCPFGVDYQFSKKSCFFKHLNVFLELGAQLYMKNVPELGKMVRGGLLGHAGIRYALNK